MQPGLYASPAPFSPAMSDQQVRPAKSWFVVAGLIAVVGIIVAVVILVLGITSYADRVDDFDRADLPATLQVEITDTGGYSIYHEYDGADGDDFSFSSQPDVSVTDPSGDQVALDPYVGSITYSASGHEGEGLYTFDADEPGAYEVTAEGGESGDGIAVGRGIGRGLVAAIVGSLAVGLLAVLAGAVLAIVVGVKRSSNRRALMPPPQFSGWGPPPPPGWGGPPGPAGGYGPPGGGYGAGAYGTVPPPAPPPPSGPSDAPAPLAPPPPPPPSGPSDAPAPASPPPRPSGPSDAPAPPADSSSPPAPGGWPGGPAPPADSSPPPGLRASGRSSAFGVAGPRASRPGAPAMRRRTAAARPVADPPSLRSPVDWARGDVPLPWSPQP